MKIIVLVEGGLVQGVYSENPSKTEVQVYDIDNIKAGDPEPTDFTYPVDELKDFEKYRV